MSEMSRRNTQEVRGQGKRPIQATISGGCSNSPALEEVRDSATVDKRKKKVRGPSKLKTIAVGLKDRKEVEFNELGQPIGDASVQLSSILGILAREYIPITEKSWDKVPMDIKDRVWEFVTQRFILDECRKDLILGMTSKKWKDFKSALSSKILQAAQGPNMARHLALYKPAEVKPNEWDEFVKDLLSVEFKIISDKHKAIRAKQVHPHTTSRRGYARLGEKLKKEKKMQVVCRVDLWIKGHIRKNGQPVNAAVDEAMKKINELPSTQNSNSVRDDALTKVLGPERPGRVRGLGFGVTPTKVDAAIQSSSRVATLENQIHQLMEWKVQMEKILSQRNTPNMDEFGGLEDMCHNSVPTPQSNQDSTCVPNAPNLGNVTCKLLHWLGTGEVVANAQIESTDPQSLVHHQMLGPDCYKVWILEILVSKVPVFRYSDVFSTLDDARGSTIAWPHRYIKFD